MTIKISRSIPKWIPPAQSPPVRENLFPAQVHDANSGELLLDLARVVVGTDRLWVFADAPQGIVCVLAQQMYEYSGDRWDGFTATMVAANSLEPGNTILVTRAQGCGCGSKLKSFRPFKASGAKAVSR